ncbi:hypothetical protein [Henriciella sp.]|uniref:hypothetical protein n=1 Tax=Henriciella sp. TaxID=1968823 RepID=UPI002608C169|nr:hypothetical protein [Henriciella sp.]
MDNLKFDKNRILRVTKVGLIANPIVADGFAIAHIDFDTRNHPDIDEFILHHQDASPGDVVTQWGSPKPDAIVLMCEFSKPAQTTFGLWFDLMEHVLSVDHIIQSKIAYLQPSGLAMRDHIDLESAKILVEIGGSTDKQKWARRMDKLVRRRLRKKGASRGEAKQAAKRMIADFRKFTQGLRQKG